MTAATGPPAWHQALAYAVTGRRYPELGRQERPDVEQVAQFLRPRLQERAPGAPRSVPADLVVDLGPAQLQAAVAELRRRLEPGQPGPRTAAADRPLNPEEQRLLRDVPPHHGT